MNTGENHSFARFYIARDILCLGNNMNKCIFIGCMDIILNLYLNVF